MDYRKYYSIKLHSFKELINAYHMGKRIVEECRKERGIVHTLSLEFFVEDDIIYIGDAQVKNTHKSP